MNEIKIKLPMRMTLKDKLKGNKEPKSYFLNLNVYRNLNMHVNNNLKKRFKKEMHRIMNEMKLEEVKFDNVTIHYDLFFPDKRNRDIMNVGSIIDKFALDALVEYGMLEDDNHEIISEQSFSFGGYDPEKIGYVIMNIREV